MQNLVLKTTIRRGINFLLLSTCIFALVFTIYAKYFDHPNINFDAPKQKSELYSLEYASIRSIEDFKAVIKKQLKNEMRDTAKLVNLIDDIIRKRFYHGYSEYSWKDNWLAVLAGKLFWYDLLCPVLEDDILNYPNAACSQQGLVFQSMMRAYGIKYATIAFKPDTKSPGGHYAVSAFYDEDWHYFDTNLEPAKLESAPSIESIIDSNLLMSIYSDKYNVWLKQKADLGLIERTNINIPSAKNAKLFHQFTYFLSNWLWLIALVMILLMNLANLKR